MSTSFAVSSTLPSQGVKLIRLLQVGWSEEVFQLARRAGHFVAAVADPGQVPGLSHGVRLVSDDEAVASGNFDAILLAIDAPQRRRRALEFYSDRGIAALSLVAGLVAQGATVGSGAVIRDFAHVSTGCRVGLGLALNVGGNIMHDCYIGDFVTVAPNAVLLGGATVGSGTYIGANATILPGVEVGADCVVGAGAVVVRNVPKGTTVKGNPAR
jgi:UDP-N-acetylbacillosamine N-acetyltransferase